jgi:uncharacterized YigZ family protein
VAHSTTAYRAVAAAAEAEVRDQGSVFSGHVLPIASAEDAKAALAAVRLRFADATHHCWAWRLGAEPARERKSDDGEPAGTAGAPILRAIESARLSDTLVVVVRWFGGVKLGKGGLARAYGAAAAAAIAAAPSREVVPTVLLEVTVPYAQVGALKRLLRPPMVELHREEYGSDAVLQVTVWRERQAELRAALADLGALVREA